MHNYWRKQHVATELNISKSMTNEAALAWHRLMMHYRMSDGIVKDDDRKLARVSGFSLRMWRKIKPELLEHFTVVNGHLRHASEDEAIADAKKKGDARREAGKRGAAARWRPGLIDGKTEETE
jgi:uncharacterized protein YdaU (DUF1376 family)